MAGAIVHVSTCELLCNTTCNVSVLLFEEVQTVCQCTAQHISQAMYLHVYRNTGAFSPNDYCLGKVMCSILWVCVCSLSYPADKARAPYYIAIYDVSCYIFPRNLLKVTIFGKKLLNTKFVFRFELHLSEIFCTHTHTHTH